MNYPEKIFLVKKYTHVNGIRSQHGGNNINKKGKGPRIKHV